MSDTFKGIANLSAEEKRAYLAELLRKKAARGGATAPPAVTEWLPLSLGQRALWFLHRLAPESAAYNLMYAAHVRSSLDVPILRQALQKLVQRHPILSATYALQRGEPAQQLHAAQPVQFEVVDASNWSEERLLQRIEEEGDRPFDLEHGPTLRSTLYMLTPRDYVFELAIHHVAADFWSFELLVDELSVLYAAEKLGIEPPAVGGWQYSDYIRWQAEMLAGPESERHWQYWQEALAGDLPVLNLPTDRPRPPVQTYRGTSYAFKLDEELTRRLKELAAAERVTPYMLLLAAFQTLLYRYTDQEDILVGTPAAGRSRADMQRTLGYFSNPVVLRADFSGNPDFKTVLGKVRRSVIGALEHQDYPFPLLVEKLQPRRDPSYSPLFQAVFVWDQQHQFDEGASLVSAQTLLFGQGETSARIAQERLRLETIVIAQRGAPFDLTLRMVELEGIFTGDFCYNTDLFDEASIARMRQHFQTLLAGIVADPEQRVGDLPLLSEAERHQMLVEWNDTRSDFPEHTSVHQLFEQQVEQQPEAVAVAFEGAFITYRALNRRANYLARLLQRSGVGPEALVGVCMERSFEMVVALLATLKAGGSYVPLDPTYPRERLDYMIQDAHPPVLLAQQRFVDILPCADQNSRVLTLDTIDWAAIDADGAHDANPASGVQPDNLAYMIYTSGSTGKPKGVMNIHRGLSNRLHWMQSAYCLTPDDRVMQKTPFSFDVSVWEFFWPLMTGARLVVARPNGHQDPSYLASLIAEQRITTLHFVPSMLQAFLMEPDLSQCSSLKRVICSGEALSFDLQETFFSRLDAELHNLYGPTEASIDVTYWRCRRGKPVYIGYPIANTQLYVLDRVMHPVPIGVAGELYIGGVGVSRGYYHRPELTAEKFVADPFSQDAGNHLFKTGDLVRYHSDGAIEFLGRADFQVKIRGFRIELGEIEAVLKQHPAIRDVVVTAREDVPGDKRLVAYIVFQPDAGSNAIFVEDLRNYLKDTLPHYMIPAAFVYLEELPLMPNGKVNRKALPAPDMTRPHLEKAYVAPRNEVEEMLANIWADILGIDRVGIYDNYFDLGGASIQSLQLIAKANEAGFHLTPEMLFEHQTVAELAAVAGTPDLVQSGSNKQEPTQAPQTSGASARHLEGRVGQRNTIIESIGTYLPPKALTTKDVLQDCTNPINFPLEQFTGIVSRRVAGETEFAVDLAQKAAESCFANSKYSPDDIDMLICSNISRVDGPDFRVSFEPGTAAQLKRRVGFRNAVIFDISNACTGMFTAILILDAFLKAGLIRRGMVVSGEYISHLTRTAQKEIESYMDSRLACLTVGDAGAAIIVEQSPSNQYGFHELELYTLGHYYDYCIAKATERDHGGAVMFTDAVRVAAVNIQQAVSHAAYTLEQSGWSPDAFQHILMHQTSTMSIRDAAREINSFFGKEICNNKNVIYNLADRGNTATTTHFVALMDRILSGEIKSGENIIFGVTGSGATIGTGLYTLDDLPDRIRKFASNGHKAEKIATQAEAPKTAPASVKRVRIASVGVVPEGAHVPPQTFELSLAAAEDALATSSYSRKDIDLLLYAGIYRDDFLSEPAIASIIAGKMQINDTIESQYDKKTFAFDVFNGSVGFLNACYAASGMIQGNKATNAMIVTSEIENNLKVASTDLLGIAQTGSALILSESGDGKTGFGNFVFKYYPEYMEAYTTYTQQGQGKTWIHAEKAPDLESIYRRCIREAVDELLNVERLDRSRIKVVLPPQLSPEFVASLGDDLGFDMDIIVNIAQENGDLFTSSLPYTLRYVQQHNLSQPGDIGLIITVGSGIQVGCAMYYF
jgi:amino acid adenylation domain-containing protein